MTGVRIGQQQQSAVIQDLTTKVQKLTGPGPYFQDPISLFTLTIGPGNSVQIAFRAAILGGVEFVQIYRGATRDFGTAKQLSSYPVSTSGIVNYTDADASLPGTKPFYWLKIVPSNANNAAIIHGPQQITVP